MHGPQNESPGVPERRNPYCTKGEYLVGEEEPVCLHAELEGVDEACVEALTEDLDGQAQEGAHRKKSRHAWACQHGDTGQQLLLGRGLPCHGARGPLDCGRELVWRQSPQHNARVDDVYGTCQSGGEPVPVQLRHGPRHGR